jgi:radical SAM superfamily enzyme YgiQ (UPF0313 family)
MTRVGLVHPSTGLPSDRNLPLGIAYVASSLRANNPDLQIRILDVDASYSWETWRFLASRFDMVGISVTTASFRNGIALAEALKKKHPATTVVLGGPYVSLMKEASLSSPAVDMCIYGEGEVAFGELIAALGRIGSARDSALAGIDGLIHRSHGNVVVNPPRAAIVDLDAIPQPALDLFPLARYEGYPVVTSRGCPHGCAFCASVPIWGRRWRPRNPEAVVDEIREVLHRYPPRPIIVEDDSVNIDRERMLRLCDLLAREKLGVPVGLRGVRVDLVDDEVAQRLRQSGCRWVAVGIESGDDVVLAKMGKRVTRDRIQTGIASLRAAGIDVAGQFMIGNPGETISTVEKTLRFAASLGLARSYWGTAVPFPGTELWRYVEAHGRFLVGTDPSLFEHTFPRIVFETPEFTAEQRLRAVRLVEACGFEVAGSQAPPRHGAIEVLGRDVLTLLRRAMDRLPPPLATRLRMAKRLGTRVLGWVTARVRPSVGAAASATAPTGSMQQESLQVFGLLTGKRVKKPTARRRRYHTLLLL